MNIYTLTLNPAFDIHAECDSFKSGHENLLKLTSKNAGGKGINISRALSSFGADNTAINILGKDNVDEFARLLEEEKLNCINIIKSGRIRENLTIHSREETRISFTGFDLDDSVFDEITPLFTSLSDSIITFTGSVPNGISKDSVIEFLLTLKSAGTKIVIDTKSLTLEGIAKINPWLIKPNEEELEAYIGEKIETEEAAKCKAVELQNAVSENVMISLGAKGAVLANGTGVYTVKAPKIIPISTVGAGDTMIAGFIYGKISEFSDLESLKFAVAAGSAACLTEGTAAPKLDKVFELIKQI